MRFSSMLTAVDVHAEGEPGRVVTAGVLDVPGSTMLDKAQWMEANADHVRQRLLREPRGYPGLCCNILVPPCDPSAHVGVIIMEQTEYPPMSGSNTICVVTALLETGLVSMVEPVTELRLDVPAGLIDVRARCEGGKVTAVTFRNVPAFAVHLDAVVDVPTLGSVTVDVAWGGMFYVIADGDELGIDLSAGNGDEIAKIGELLRTATVRQLPVSHPDEPSLTGPTISQLSGRPSIAGAHRRNAVVISTGTVDLDRPESATGVLDRCPCGTGTAAKMATLYARGALKLGSDFVHEGPLGTTFTGRLIAETTVGPYPAVVTEITGQGWITGFANYVVDPTDPFPRRLHRGRYLVLTGVGAGETEPTAEHRHVVGADAAAPTDRLNTSLDPPTGRCCVVVGRDHVLEHPVRRVEGAGVGVDTDRAGPVRQQYVEARVDVVDLGVHDRHQLDRLSGELRQRVDESDFPIDQPRLTVDELAAVADPHRNGGGPDRVEDRLGELDVAHHLEHEQFGTGVGLNSHLVGEVGDCRLERRLREALGGGGDRAGDDCGAFRFVASLTSKLDPSAVEQLELIAMPSRLEHMARAHERVGNDQLGAHVEVPSVHVEHGLGVDQRRQRTPGVLDGRDRQQLQLGARGTVDEDRVASGESGGEFHNGSSQESGPDRFRRSRARAS